MNVSLKPLKCSGWLVDLGFNVQPPAVMETGPQLIVSSGRLEKPVIEPVTPGLQGE